MFSGIDSFTGSHPREWVPPIGHATYVRCPPEPIISRTANGSSNPGFMDPDRRRYPCIAVTDDLCPALACLANSFVKMVENAGPANCERNEPSRESTEAGHPVPREHREFPRQSIHSVTWRTPNGTTE